MKRGPAWRRKLPDSAFAIPERRAWPIHDLRHVRIAMRYMDEGKGNPRDYARVRAAIKKRWGRWHDEYAGEYVPHVTMSGSGRARHELAGGMGSYRARRDPEKKATMKKRAKAYGPYKRKGGGKTVIIVQRDPERELRKASTKTLLKLLDHCEKKGDHQLCRMVEKELDRRGRGF